MNYVMEITEEKYDMMSQEVENALMSLGNVMHCLEQMKGESRMQERMGNRMGNQGYGVGNRVGDRMGNRGNGGNMGNRMWQPNDYYDGMGRGRYDGY